MSILSPGEVVLLFFPYTGLNQGKRRPALVLKIPMMERDSSANQ